MAGKRTDFVWTCKKNPKLSLNGEFVPAIGVQPRSGAAGGRRRWIAAKGAQGGKKELRRDLRIFLCFLCFFAAIPLCGMNQYRSGH
jgi:hypothetical protein